MIAVKAARLEAADEGVRPRRSKSSSASSTYIELTQQPRVQLTAEQLEQQRARVSVLITVPSRLTSFSHVSAVVWFCIVKIFSGLKPVAFVLE